MAFACPSFSEISRHDPQTSAGRLRSGCVDRARRVDGGAADQP
jgi:hypothetical protein